MSIRYIWGIASRQRTACLGTKIWMAVQSIAAPRWTVSSTLKWSHVLWEVDVRRGVEKPHMTVGTPLQRFTHIGPNSTGTVIPHYLSPIG